ncbi:hypothetical protein TRFO_33477 [Tritrichomonas foetus]|uniref:Uncharacterized protein n=1 Tax=Tritrichomonas foetus TaxID=1144522 RepID=A0A1J4JR25_9EUKA|nr:hypothetical protein TRFO_33477 [Tritrichomonas foetus]|eukprot:OHS99963.1 hypothetical protein TRFO_33477 [Tritrichomonas foetus]
MAATEQLPPLNLTMQPSSRPAMPSTPQSARVRQPNTTLAKTQQPFTRQKSGRLDPRLFALSSGRIRPAREVWVKLKDQLVDFTHILQIDIAVPSFMEQYLFVARYFNLFNQYAIQIFNSIHPTDYPRAHMTKTAFYQNSRCLLIEWAEFIDLFNKIRNSKMGPIFPIVLKSLEKVQNQLDKVAELFIVGSLKSDVKPSTMRKIDTEMYKMQKMVKKRIRDEEDELFLDFDMAAFIRRVLKFANGVQSIFSNASMPRYTSSTGEVMVERMNLLVYLNELIDLMNGISHFDPLCNMVRNTIIEMTNQLKDLYLTLNFKFDLVLDENCYIVEQPERPKIPIPPKPENPAETRSPRKITMSSL